MVAVAPEPPDDPRTLTDRVNDAEGPTRPMQSFSDIVLAALQDSSSHGTQGGSTEEQQGDTHSSDRQTSTPDGHKVGFA